MWNRENGRVCLVLEQNKPCGVKVTLLQKNLILLVTLSFVNRI